MNRLGQALKETLIDILESDEIDNIKRKCMRSAVLNSMMMER